MVLLSHAFSQNKKIPFYGNSTTYSFAYIFSKTSYISFDIGRTYGRTYSSGGVGLRKAHSVGLGYSYPLNISSAGLYKIYYQFDLATIPQYISPYIFPPLSLRLDILSDKNFRALKVCPNIGIGFLVGDLKLDLLYGYIFNSEEAKNCVTIRLNYIPHAFRRWPDESIK
jgi:hypothetical protein